MNISKILNYKCKKKHLKLKLKKNGGGGTQNRISENCKTITKDIFSVGQIRCYGNFLTNPITYAVYSAIPEGEERKEQRKYLK